MFTQTFFNKLGEPVDGGTDLHGEILSTGTVNNLQKHQYWRSYSFQKATIYPLFCSEVYFDPVWSFWQSIISLSLNTLTAILIKRLKRLARSGRHKEYLSVANTHLLAGGASNRMKSRLIQCTSPLIV